MEFSAGFNFTWYHSIAAKTNEDKVTLSNPYTRKQGYLYGYLGTGYVGTQFYTNPQDILNNPKRIKSQDLRPGDLWFADVNGDGKIDGQDQRKYGHDATPRFVFGFDLSASWKGLSVLANIKRIGFPNASGIAYILTIEFATSGDISALSNTIYTLLIIWFTLSISNIIIWK
mgnify:CR=1 FL=1